METEYPTLGRIGVWTKRFGKLTIVLAFFGAAAVAAVPFTSQTGVDIGVMRVAFATALATLGSGLTTGIILIAAGDLIRLLINLAEDTAESVEYTERVVQLLEKAAVPAPGTARPADRSTV